MRVLRIFSAVLSGNSKSFFEKAFQGGSLSPPEPSSIVPLAWIVPGWNGLKQGVVSHADVTDNAVTVWIRAETPTKDLREYLVPDGWKEVFEKS